MMNQKCVPVGYLSLAVPGSTGVGFAGAAIAGTTALFVIPTNANMVLLIGETGVVRWRDDGVAPGVSSGMPIQPTSTPLEYSGNLSAIKFAGVTGTVAVDASFYQTAG